MNIIDFEIEKWNTILLRLNWVAIIIAALLILGISIVIKHVNFNVNKQSITVDEINLGIGNNRVKLSYCKKGSRNCI